MKASSVIAVTLAASLLSATSAVGSDRRFVASSMPGAGLKKPGKVVITNTSKAITAYRFFGDIRESLFSIRSKPAFATRPYGSVVFDPSAGFAAPRHLTSVIQEASRQHGVDPRLVAAVVRRESAWNANAVSPVGACGLMQLMPATARYLGVRDVFDARENVFGGTRYLRTLLDTFNGDLDLALAAYNAGPGAVAKYGGVPPYRETRAYVAAVRGNYEAALRQ
jgi:soluble lytic murein transglycosylase-like protein